MENNINWPGWETVGLIGRGSFGAVYEIQRDVLGDVEKAALKVLSIPQSSGDIDEMYNDGYDDESITSTFQRHLKSIVAEYSLMRKMSGSANIVNCDDVRYVQHEDGFGWDIFIKMELLTPLAKALPADIPEETVIKVAKDLCAALELCKQHDIVHRDIKPQNIFLSPNGDYKLGDFGIAKTVEKTMGGTKTGTYKYMAPEVYNNQPYGAAADIYSLGLVLYWMLNERRMPFLPLPPAMPAANMEAQARLRRFNGEQLPPPAHGSKQLQKIILKACAYDPKERYQSAAEMHKDLNSLFNNSTWESNDSFCYQDTIAIKQVEQEETQHRTGETEDARILRDQEIWERDFKAQEDTLLRKQAERERILKEQEIWERDFKAKEEARLREQERILREQETWERIQREQEAARLRKEQAERERILKEQEIWERSFKAQEKARLRKEREEKERILREQEIWERDFKAKRDAQRRED